MAKNVLYLSYDGMTDPLGQSQVLPYIIGLSKKGYSFHLISFEKPDRFKAHRDKIDSICEINGISWHPLIYTKHPPLFSTMWDVNRMKRKAFRLHKEHKFILVHCRSYLSALVGLSLKKRYKVRFLFDMRGFWADERVDGKLWNLKNPLYKWVYNYFKNKERSFLLEANHSVSLTYAGKNDILGRQGFGHLEDKISVIPCCADLGLFKPFERDSEEFTLGYLGSLGTWYMLKEMLMVYAEIQKIIPNTKFHFLTKDDASLVYTLAKELGINDNNIQIEESDRDQIPYNTRNWNYSIFFILPCYSKISSSPTKQGELMGMGIPIICNSGVGDVDEIVESYNSGYVVKDLNSINAEHILSRTFVKKDMTVGAHDYFSLEKGIESYQKIYSELC